MNDIKTVTLYRFMCEETENDIKYYKEAHKCITHPYEYAHASGLYIIRKADLDKIDPHSYIMWSLDDNMDKYIARLIHHENKKLLSSINRINKIRKQRIDSYDDETRKDLKRIYRFISNTVYGASDVHRYSKLHTDTDTKLDLSIEDPVKYNMVLHNMDIATFNPSTMDINDYIKSLENTDM